MNKHDQTNKSFKSILVIYLGGIFGMVKRKMGNYVPKARFLYDYIKNHPNLCDSEFTSKYLESNSDQGDYFHLHSPQHNENQVVYQCSLNKAYLRKDSYLSEYDSEEIKLFIKPYSKPSSVLFTPKNLFDKRIGYQILEFNQLMDSSNVNLEIWNQLSKCIHDFYHCYDGFVIISGTDTMSYTASILSFALEGLGKPVIFTGSQIPLIETSNDALLNLIDSIIIAGSFNIPEVLIYFRGHLLRGNRTIKNRMSSLQAFESPNYPALITTGTKYKVNWDLILHRKEQEVFNVLPLKNNKILIIKYFPTISDEMLQSILDPENKAIIIETYGSGNLPNNSKMLVSSLLQLNKSNILIVNVSQCRKGFISNDYEVGKPLEKLGIIYASDMTVECVLAKITYLLSKNYSLPEIKKLIGKNLRGELTEIQNEQFSMTNRNLIVNLKSLITSSQENEEILFDGAYQELIISMIKSNKLDELKRMNLDLNSIFEKKSCKFKDGKTPVHYACEYGLLDMLNFLIDCKLKISVIDNYGNSPLYYACLNGHKDVAARLYQAEKNKNKLISGIDVRTLIRLAWKGKNEALILFCNYYKSLILYGDEIDNKTIAHVLALKGNVEMISYLNKHSLVPLESLIDRFNKCPYDYATEDVKLILKPLNNHN